MYEKQRHKEWPLISDPTHYCEKHQVPFTFLLPDKKKSICLECEKEQNNQFEQKMQQACLDIERLRKYNMLIKHSIVQDNTIAAATFDNFMAETVEEKRNKSEAMKFAELMANGAAFNVWIQSPQTGCGKSHLGMSMLKYVNEYGAKNKSTLFLDFARTMELVKDSFSNKESMYTENYIVTIANQADVLVIDDLGAETGDIYTHKRASEYTSSMLRSIFNGRQDKATIITTNLTGKRIATGYYEGNRFIPPMYDKKMISRAMQKMKQIIFSETPDKRLGELDF